MIDQTTIRKTFCEDAIRTVMLIDDEFPTYADLHTASLAAKQVKTDQDTQTDTEQKPAIKETKTVKWEPARARALYDAFKERALFCDIENDPSKLAPPHVDRVRKSDLIILDYNLKGSDDSTDSVTLLRLLAESPHFNLVVVYTKEELDKVWIKVAANLRGGWKSAKDLLDEDSDAYAEYRDFRDNQSGYEVEKSIVESFILDGRRAFKNQSSAPFKSDLEAAGVERELVYSVMEALIHEQVVRQFGVNTESSSKTVSGRFSQDGVSWLHCGTVFVTFMKKRDETQDASTMYQLLEDALVAWKPNVLQVFLSQIQNTLELQALAYDERFFDSEELQAGWIYHALTEIQEKGAREEGVPYVVEKLFSRVLDTIGTNLKSQHHAYEKGVELFKNYLQGQPTIVSFKDRMAKAIELSHPKEKLQGHGVLHALNSYLSTETFHGEFITNGTLFFEVDGTEHGDWWICTSPACDLVPRPIKDQHSWNSKLHPYISMTALRLQFAGLPKNSNLEVATQGRLIYVKHDGKQLCFNAFHPTTHQPRPASFLITGASPVKDGRFEAQVMMLDSDNKPGLKKKSFTVGGQLRSDYASRLLQQVGSHGSRIGVDFVDYIVVKPKPSTEAETSAV